MRLLVRVLASLLVVGGSLITPTAARASCVDDPEAYTPKKMIRRGETGDDHYERLFLGRVRQIRDPERTGGDVIVRLKVREVPFGPDRRWLRIRDWMEPPGVGSSAEYNFVVGRYYAVVAHVHADGTVSHDGPCGGTERLHPSKFRRLIRLSREV